MQPSSIHLFELNGVSITYNNSTLHLGHYINDEYNKRFVTRGINSSITQTNTLIQSFISCPSNVKMSRFNLIIVVITDVIFNNYNLLFRQYP